MQISNNARNVNCTEDTELHLTLSELNITNNTMLCKPIIFTKFEDNILSSVNGSLLVAVMRHCQERDQPTEVSLTFNKRSYV